MNKTSQRRVWNFEDFESWRPLIIEMIAPEVDEAVFAAFRNRPPKYIVGDDLEWLDDFVERVSGDVVDTRFLLANRLHRHFDAIRGYHGARPVDIQTYQTRGIQLPDAESLAQQARELFLSGSYPEFARSDVDAAIERVPRDMTRPRVHFEASKQWLEDHCAHYMLYGSEFIGGVAACLWSTHGRDYRQDLKTVGQPTVFVCDVPLNWMRPELLEGFAGQALEALFNAILDPGYGHPPSRDHGLTIRQTLPPEYIVGHYVPDRLRDPLLGGRLIECM